MCELTYTNMHESYKNSLIIYLLGKIGSERHDDGCGFICPDNRVFKSELPAKNITNLGTILNINLVDNKAVPFHIRSATWGIEVTKENAHPFDGKHFILMHNGTLLPRNGEEPKDKKHDSDSLKFLKTLDECKDINPQGTFEEIFNAAMNNFAGKFAFIIREKETGFDYIVRGRTAELWITKVSLDDKSSGYVINTSKDTLKSAMMQFINIWDIFFTENVTFSEPVLIEAESIFLAKEDAIEKIGSTKEITPVKENKSAITPYRSRDNWEYGRGYDEDNETKEIAEKAYKIYEFLSDNSMGLLDFQLMIMISGGISVLELTEQDLEMFIDYIIPKISANKKIRNEVKKILEGTSFPHELYKEYDLEYPWTVNDGQTVIKNLKEYMKTI